MKTYNIYITHMLALCHIYKDYPNFKENLQIFLRDYYTPDSLRKLKLLANGEHVFGSKSLKNFYNFNKETIDIINSYAHIQRFIFINFDKYGVLEQGSDLDYFYNYLLKHENEIDTIISLLEKLKELGFIKFSLQEKMDFSNSSYKINKNYQNNNQIVYLANMKALPVYNSSQVSYKSDDSNYKIIINNINGEKRFQLFLNSLTIDSKTLPNSLQASDIMNDLLKLDLEITEENEIFRDIIDISDSVEILITIYKIILERIKNINYIENKTDILSILKIIETKLEDLMSYTNDQKLNIIGNNNIITEEIFRQEKAELQRVRKNKTSNNQQ